MKCIKIQEIIITDYMDGRLESGRKAVIDAHLGQCPACSHFWADIQSTMEPIARAPQAIADNALWDKIEQSIREQEDLKLAKSLRPSLWDILKKTVLMPRPAFALATIVTMVLVIGSTGQMFLMNPVVKIDGPAQVEYVSSLMDESVSLDTERSNDVKTPIEQYFL